MDEFIGIIKLFAGSFAPRGWAFCDGSILPIAQNTALFSILGTTYGGNGVQNFALPDLRGRVAAGAGSGPGLSPRTPGQAGGAENGAVPTTTSPGTTNQPGILAAANYPDESGGQIAVNVYASGALQVPTMPPFLGMNYIICLQGLYPPRN